MSCHKKKFDSYEYAAKFLAAQPEDYLQTVYWCRSCKAYHNTKSAPIVRKGRRKR